MSDTLTLNQAGHLADLIRGVERGKKLEWYPAGSASTHGEPRKLELTLRAFTDASGNFYDFTSDIRDAHVWCSGMMESWLKVREVIAALANAIDGTSGLDKPMAVIREVTA